MLCYVCYVQDVQSYGSVVQLWRSLCGSYVPDDSIYTLHHPQPINRTQNNKHPALPVIHVTRNTT